MDGGGHAAGGHGAGHGAPATPFSWALPDGWEERAPNSIRIANFGIEADPAAECYLASLPGAAGGLVANVNRWREQMGLQAMPEVDIRAMPQKKMLGRNATFIDIEGEFTGMGGGGTTAGYRMLGFLLELPQVSLFLKMTGPAATLEHERENFMALAASLQFGGGGDRKPAGGAAQGGAASSGGLSWNAPEGWEQQPSRSMRAVTYRPAGDPEAQCYVSIWPGNVGGLLMNINRWRGEAGAAPLTLAEIDAFPKTKALGREVALLHVEGDFRGMGGAPLSGAGLMAIFCELSGRTVTVKMTGPAALVAKEKDNFVAFCESLKADG